MPVCYAQNEQREPLLDFIEAVSTVYPRDLSSVIKVFSNYSSASTSNPNMVNSVNAEENSLGSYRSTRTSDSFLARSEYPLPLSDDGLGDASLQQRTLPGLQRI